MTDDAARHISRARSAERVCQLIGPGGLRRF
jgi:hypothetical protein